MRAMFNVTYEIITPESAACGDVESRGFVTGMNDRTELLPNVVGAVAGAIKRQCALNLRVALECVGLLEDSGNWFTEVDPRKHYGTGDEEWRSLHPPRDITAASYARLKRLLNVK